MHKCYFQNGWLHNNAKNIPHKTFNKKRRKKKKSTPNTNIFYKPRNLKFKSSTFSVSVFRFFLVIFPFVTPKRNGKKNEAPKSVHF